MRDTQPEDHSATVSHRGWMQDFAEAIAQDASCASTCDVPASQEGQAAWQPQMEISMAISTSGTPPQCREWRPPLLPQIIQPQLSILAPATWPDNTWQMPFGRGHVSPDAGDADGRSITTQCR